MVRQSSGEGHAILSVNTTAGDFILDNLEPKVLLWSDTGYTYLKRQSRSNSGHCEAIESQQNILVSGTK
ncbi:transglutaminase-like cysteine peptidase [Mesorhizobium sp. M0019]|uniref:transglutaminase-like cysteine peptidase n=1 Tax=unclassified Mesorhizobium TaxID=325217 RepID=UPI00333D9592